MSMRRICVITEIEVVGGESLMHLTRSMMSWSSGQYMRERVNGAKIIWTCSLK